jgi:hypothetical protein
MSLSLKEKSSRLNALGSLLLSSVIQLGTALDRCNFFNSTGLACNANIEFAIACGFVSTFTVISMLVLGHSRPEKAQRHERIASLILVVFWICAAGITSGLRGLSNLSIILMMFVRSSRCIQWN